MFKLSKTISNTKRVTKIFTTLSKYGFDGIVSKLNVDKVALPFIEKQTTLSKEERVKNALEELGPTFIKIAQMLSTRPDLIPLELIVEFEKLQDSVTPTPFEKIQPILESELSHDISKLFKKDLELLASASIGQVYKATLLTDEEVVIKVLKPEIKKIIKSDITLLKQLSEIFDSSFKEYGVQSLVKIVNEFEKTINEELNYKLEALNISRFASIFADDQRIVTPKLYQDLCSENIITMEYIDGIKVSDLQSLEEAQIDKDMVANNGFELICQQIFKHRFFHGDPHPGNIFVTKDSKVVFIDFGMMGKLTKKEQKRLTDLFYSISKEEYEESAENILELCSYPSDLNKEQFIKDMSTLIATYSNSSLEKIQINDLFRESLFVASNYKISLKPSYYLFFKAIVSAEGIGVKLQPKFNATKKLVPIIHKFYKEQLLSNLFKQFKYLPSDLMSFFSHTPNSVKELLKQMRDGKFTIELKHVGLEQLEESIEKSFNRLTVSVVAASTLIGSSLLLHAKVPPLIYDIPIFGLAGFSVACVMGAVLAYSIYKGGKL